jgi:hypothetical protein
MCVDEFDDLFGRVDQLVGLVVDHHVKVVPTAAGGNTAAKWKELYDMVARGFMAT